jgi:hypothetical protein
MRRYARPDVASLKTEYDKYWVIYLARNVTQDILDVEKQREIIDDAKRMLDMEEDPKWYSIESGTHTYTPNSCIRKERGTRSTRICVARARDLAGEHTLHAGLTARAGAGGVTMASGSSWRRRTRSSASA